MADRGTRGQIGGSEGGQGHQRADRRTKGWTGDQMTAGAPEGRQECQRADRGTGRQMSTGKMVDTQPIVKYASHQMVT